MRCARRWPGTPSTRSSTRWASNGGAFDVADAGERGRLTVDGLKFLREDGTIFQWRGLSDFSLFHRFLIGEDIEPILVERIGLGANLLRVFGMYNAQGIGAANGLGELRPSAYTPVQVSAFLTLLGDFGLRCEWVLLADAMDWTPAQAQAHVHAYAETLSAWNVCVEVANEPFKNISFPAKNLAIPAGWLYSYGDYEVQAPGFAAGRYVTWHSDRKPDWPRTPRGLGEIRDDINGGTNCPVVADEPTGCAEVPRGDSRSSTPEDFRDYAATCALMGAGATFHPEDGIASRLLGPVQTACAEAFFAGLSYIPVTAQLAPYMRGGANDHPVGDLPVRHFDLEDGPNPAALRTFAKNADGFSYYVRIRARGATEPRAGWTIDEEPFPGIGRCRR